MSIEEMMRTEIGKRIDKEDITDRDVLSYAVNYPDEFNRLFRECKDKFGELK